MVSSSMPCPSDEPVAASETPAGGYDFGTLLKSRWTKTEKHLILFPHDRRISPKLLHREPLSLSR
jgi:hypothetical protein